MGKEETEGKSDIAGGERNDEESKQHEDQQQRLVDQQQRLVAHQRSEYYQQQPRTYLHQYQSQPFPYEYPSYPDWAAMQQQQVYHHYGYQYPVQPMEGVPLPLPPGIPGLGGSTDPLEAVLGPFPCARLRNLPFSVELEDILLLFQGLVVIDVVLDGHGEAFVIFANPMDYQMALQRDRQSVGRQLVDIKSASRDEYYAAVAKTVHEQDGGKLGREDIMGDKQDRIGGPGSSSLWSSGSSHNPPSGAVIAPIGTSNFSPIGQQQHLGSGSLAMSGRSSGSSRPSLHAPLQKRTGGGIQVGEHTGFLRMRGLPFSSTKEDIFHFFEGYHPVQESIVLTYRNDGRATGEAYVGFATPEDSKRAMELHRRMMGSRYIELFISNKDEQGRALVRFGNR